jgi:hypothetical protein
MKAKAVMNGMIITTVFFDERMTPSDKTLLAKWNWQIKRITTQVITLHNALKPWTMLSEITREEVK